MSAELLNELTGEAVLTDKADRKYHVLFDLSAVMEAEQMTGQSAMQLISQPPSARGCLAMIIAGTNGYGRRNPGAPKVNPKLAQRILIDSGGVARIAQVLVVSMSCAEGLGLNDDESDDEGEAGPLASPPL